MKPCLVGELQGSLVVGDVVGFIAGRSTQTEAGGTYLVHPCLGQILMGNSTPHANVKATCCCSTEAHGRYEQAPGHCCC